MTDKQLYRFSVACGVLTGIFLLAAWQPSIDHDAAALRQHCQMVALWESSRGEYGWPDYNRSAHLCPEEKRK
jgi:hypothetical protein